MSYVIRDCLFLFSSLCDWSEKLTLFSQPIRCKTKTNFDLVACVFPRFRRFGRLYSEFLLALRSIFLSSDWSLWFFWFWFYDTQSKSAISKQFCDPHWGSSIILCHWIVTLDGTKLATDLMCFVCNDTNTVALGWTLEETPWKDFDPSAVKRLFVLSLAYESSSETMDFQSRIPELRTTFASPSGADEVLQW